MFCAKPCYKSEAPCPKQSLTKLLSVNMVNTNDTYRVQCMSILIQACHIMHMIPGTCTSAHAICGHLANTTDATNIYSAT